MAKEKRAKIRPEKTVVSLEIHGRRLKLCEAAFFKQGDPVFRLFTGEIPETPGDIPNSITNFFTSHDITTRKVFLNIPRHTVMARILHLPSVNDEEIRNMAGMEAAKQIPYRDESIITGYRVIRKFKDGYSDILLAISQADTISRLMEMLKNSNLTAEKIALSSESLFLWYSAILEKSRKETNASMALINIDSVYVDMVIIMEGGIVFARAFSYESGRPDATRQIADEIKRSITIYQKEKNLKIDRIFITGRVAEIKMIEPVLKEEANIPAEIIAQTEGIELVENPGDALNDTSFVELIGLSLKSGEAKIDLLPKEMKEDKEFSVFKKSARKTLILFGCVMLVLFGATLQKIVTKSGLLRAFDAKLEAIAPGVLEAKRMRGDLKIIKTEIRKKPLAIDILAEIYRITPSDINFNLVDYESDKSLLLRGRAASLDSVVRFMAILEDSPYLENIKLKYTTKRSVKGREKTDFEIVCLLTKGK